MPSPGSQPKTDREAATLQRAVATLISPQGHADDANLNAACATLRRLSPMHWVVSPGIRPFWAVTRYADIVTVELQSQEFAAAPRTYLASEIAETVLRQITGKPQVVRGLTEMDEPDHEAYRSIIQPSFAQGALRAQADWLSHWAAEMVEEIAERDGICDFAADIAAPYTFRTIARLLGLPEADDAPLLRLAQGFVGAEDPDRRLADMPTEAIRAAMVELCRYFDALIINRQARPRDDLASLIANARIRGERIPRYEMLSYFILMVTAGHDTTALAIAGGLHALLEHPDQLARLRQEPALLESAIEEMLRWTSPVRHFMRTAVQTARSEDSRSARANRWRCSFIRVTGTKPYSLTPIRFGSTVRPILILPSAAARISAWGISWHGWRCALFSRSSLRRTESIELTGRTRRARSVFMTGITSLPIRCGFQNMGCGR